jgi:eukaryotic-like serine/threonine-protein kinase
MRRQAFAASFGHRSELALRLAEASASSYEQNGDLRNACWLRAEVGLQLAQLGAYAEAEIASQQALLTAVEIEIPYLTSPSKMILGRIHTIRGDAASARPLLVDAAEKAGRQRNMEIVGFSRVALARALEHLGELEDACREATEAVEIAVPFPQVHAAAQAVLARLLLRRGRRDEALRASSGAFEICGALGSIELDDAHVRLIHAEVLDACGLRDASRAVLVAARDRLRADAEMISSPAFRRSFLEAVPEHARIFELASS